MNSKCVINSCTDSSIPNLCVVNGANACVNTQSNDASHCGACNYKCASNKVPNATSSTCASGKCQYVCATVNNVKYVNVGTGIAAGTILCINPDTNPDYCGATGNASGSASTAQKGTKCKSGEVCVGGSCVINQCASNSSNPNLCVVDGVNVCKNVNSNDAEHCGACNYQCSAHNIPNATSNACAAGKCQYQCVKTNDVEYVNVGTGVTEDTILCIDPNIDSRYCGATAGNKGKSCPTGDVCVGGVCVHNSCTSSDFPDLCVVNKENVCVNIQSDADHCGACNYACENHTIMDGDSVVAKSTGCSAGHCLYECRNDLVNIGSGVTAETIRCIDPNNDSTHCGAKSASVPGVDCNNNEELHSLRGTCENGTCHITECGYGYHRVNGNPVTCELNTPKVCGVRDSETFDVDDCTPLAMPNKAICDLGGACFIGSCVAHAHEIESGCVCDTEYTSNDAKTQCISDADYCRDNSVTKCVNEGKTGMLYGCSENSWTEPTTCKNGYSCAENVCGVCVDDNTQCSGRMLQTCQDGDWTETECEADKICFEGACNVCDLNAHVFGNECETDDIANCGEHDYKCDDALIPHGKSFSCISKVCRVNSCSDGYHVHENGCEEDSIAHCGEHDHACEVDNADNTCRNGECVFTCLSGYHSYDGACEPDDRNNCGAHEIACQNTEICVSGSCKSCPANQHVYGETCEPDDRNNCGAHETTCQNTEICDSGSCKSCLENQHVYGDTCEPDDRDNCGAHGNACINNKVCRSGACLDCEANSHAYENNCEPDDRNNCGAHENACTNNQVCLSGTCSDCGANSHVYENSCEANDGDNCGTHGNACGADNPAHSTVWGCNTNGVCIASSCEEGYHVYEGACEEDSITNCGSHGQSCTIQNGSPSCSTGVCKAASCDNGYHGYGNECEKDSNDNCGAHAYSCVEPSTCQNGQCQI